jgi:methionyl-tRNA synthetase
VGKYINIASRSAGFLVKNFEGRVLDSAMQHPLLLEIRAQANAIATHYDEREYGKAIREVMACADKVNAYVDQEKPWELAKNPDKQLELQTACTICLEAFRLLTLYLKPVLPVLAGNAENILGVAPMTWADVNTPLSGTTPVQAFKHLMQRVDQKQIDALIDANKQSLAPAAPVATATTSGEFISIDDFTKIDLRIGLVKECKAVEGSTKLLQLTVDLGEEKPRNIFSGIAAHYTPDNLTGQYVVVVANLAPRKMKFGISEGMVLCAASENDATLSTLTALGKLTPGMKIS